MKRRDLLKSGVVLPSLALANGCCLIPKPNINCLYDAFIPHQSGLLIDTHAHVFNGADLQVAEFIKQVKGEEITSWRLLQVLLGDVLALLAWVLAPSVKKEMKVINDFTQCEANNTEVVNTFIQKRDEQFIEARKQIFRAIDELESQKNEKYIAVNFNAVKASFPDSYEELYEPSGAYIKMGAQQVDLKQAWRFVVEMFQYRYVSLYNYLTAYNNEKRKTDFMLAHLVDYDWPLAKGKSTTSTLPEQMLLMSTLVKKSKGMMQYFVSYCPFRHIAFKNDPKSTFDPIALIREAVEKHGAIGVKMYPPMGFAVYGNTAVEADNERLWIDQRNLPGLFKRKGTGQALDNALTEFYTLCEKLDIPVMAHSSPSNMASDAYKVLFDDKYWSSVFTTFPKLKMSFGHLGGFGDTCGDNGCEYASQIIDQLSADDVSGRGFADLAYISNMLKNPDAVERSLRNLLSDRPNMINALVYGSDWKMLVIEQGNEHYLSRFQEILNHLQLDETEKNKLLAGNAIQFLGLYKGGKNRERVESFFEGEELPHWLAKV